MSVRRRRITGGAGHLPPAGAGRTMTRPDPSRGYAMRLFVVAALFAVGCTPPVGPPRVPVKVGKADSPPSAPAEFAVTVDADSGEAVTVGDIKISFGKPAVGKVQVKGFGDAVADSDETYLKVPLVVANGSAAKKFDYRSVNRLHAPSLKDEHGNSYKMTDPGINDIVGHTPRAPVYPGKSVADVWLFEPPVAAATEASLVVPLEPFGGTGRAMVKMRLR